MPKTPSSASLRVLAPSRDPSDHLPANVASVPRVAVIVLNWNGLADTEACLASCFAQTWPSTEIWLVDNASANGEGELLASRYSDRVRMLRNAVNLGFTGGNNVAIRQILREGQADYIALLNNDATAIPEWIEMLVASAAQHPNVGMFASHMVFTADHNRTENTGTEILTTGEAIPRGRNKPVSHFSNDAELLGACGGAVLYRVELLARLGAFRDDFFANFEDVDLSLRHCASGYFARFVAGAIVHHKLNASIAKVRDDRFRVRSVRNLSTAYLINMPWTVIVLNLPWLVVSWCLVPLIAPLLGQFDLARILVRGRARTLLELRSILRERRRLRPLRRGNPLRIWWMQRSCVRVYLDFLLDVVILRRRRYLE